MPSNILISSSIDILSSKYIRYCTTRTLLECGVLYKEVAKDGSYSDIENVNNIEILSPVNRNELIENYLFADILFLHLNDIPAFRRVLPSKIFEYVALRKPIVAGLSGYSAQFMADNVPSAIVFSPGDVDGCVDAIKKIENIKSTSDDINMFIKKYSREKIMNKMAEHILTSILIKL